MNLKKVLTLLLATAMVTSLFAGCGSSSDEAAPAEEGTTAAAEETSTESGEPTQLTIWTPPLDSDTEANWRPLLEKFEQENNCEITLELIPWANYQEKYVTAINAEEGPDIGYMYNELYPTFIDAGAIDDLTPYLEESDYEYYNYIDNTKMYGGTYGLPIVSGVPFVMYYNKDILDSLGETAPETWEDFYRICEKATQDTDGDGKVDQYGVSLGWGGTTVGQLNSNWYMWLWQAGGDIYNEDCTAVRFNDEAGLEAANFLMSLKPFMPEDAMSLTNSDAFQKVFGEGKAAFSVTRSSQTQETQFAETYPNLNWDYVTSLKNKEYGTFGATDSLVLMNACENKELAVKLMKYIVSPEFMTEYHKTCPGAPLTVDEPYQGDAKMERIVTEDIDKLRGLTVGPKGQEIYEYLWKQLQLMFEGTQTPEESLNNAAEYANGLLDEYWAGK